MNATHRQPGTRLLRGARLSAVGAAALLAYAHLIEPRRLVVERWTVRVPDLPPAWEGMRAVHLTDFQIGMWLQSRSLVRRAVDLALSLRPDVVFLTGDFMHHGRWSDEGAVFGDLARRAPVYAVLGNHDYVRSAAAAAEITAGLRAQGITVLMNEHAPFAWRGERWTVVGVDDLATRHTDLLKAVSGIPPDTKLLAILTHVPDAADFVPPGWFPLIVAGHTHGGQVRLPPVRRLSWVRLSTKLGGSNYPWGWYDTAGGLLYVNRGVGMAALPLRLGVPPEVTLMVLTDGRALPHGRRWQRRG